MWAKNASRDAEIVRLAAAGFSQRVVARSVGVSQSTVNRVLHRLEEAEDGALELRVNVPEPVAEDLEELEPEWAQRESRRRPSPKELEPEDLDLEPETLLSGKNRGAKGRPGGGVDDY